jgi:glycosyltransferase involved in cell wall biosynthesis
MDAFSAPRVTLVHDWLTGMRGGEKCLEAVCRRWPQAQLYTLLHRRGSVSPTIERLRPRASLLNRLPGVHRYYRWLLPLMPAAVAAWRLPPADLVVSFSHCVAKNVRPPAGVPHVCYCFTPMRYAWHMRRSYFRRRGPLGWVRDSVLAGLREWDRRTADHVTHFVAISETVRQRIRECYGREAEVIYPPVDCDFYHPVDVPREDFYLVVSAFAPYKRFDLALDACQALGRKLVVIGSGQEAARLRKRAGGAVAFLGWKPDEVIRDHFRRCKALLFPGEEDFGIVPVEAMACGAPVIGYGCGGLTETVLGLDRSPAPTGVFFQEQSVEALIAAIKRFEAAAGAFTPAACRRRALDFQASRFRDELFAYLDGVLHGLEAHAPQAA